MKIGSLAVKGTFAAMLGLTALRWMVPAPEPVAQRQVGMPGLDEPAPHAAERTFFLTVTEPPLPEAGAGKPADHRGPRDPVDAGAIGLANRKQIRNK